MRNRLIVVAAAICLLLFGLAYSAYYPIEEDGANLAEYANHHLNIGAPSPMRHNIRLLDSVSMGKQKYTLFTMGEDIGFIRMSRGLNGRYRISSMRYGRGNFLEETVEEDGGQYFVIGGRNAFFGIASVSAVISGREYRLEVREGDRFIAMAEVDGRTEGKHILPEDIRFYNAAGEDITASVPWN